MLRIMLMLALVAGMLGISGVTEAQQEGKKKDNPKAGKEGAPNIEQMMERLLSFDKNNDGKLSKDELSDERLSRIFEQADTDKDGLVTKDELKKLLETRFSGAGRPREKKDDNEPSTKGNPAKKEAPEAKSKEGFGGPRGGFRPPRPGEILPSFLQEMLQMTEAQQKDLATIQKEVDAKLEKLLTPEQKKMLQELRERGPAGPGGPPPRPFPKKDD